MEEQVNQSQKFDTVQTESSLVEEFAEKLMVSEVPQAGSLLTESEQGVNPSTMILDSNFAPQISEQSIKDFRMIKCKFTTSQLPQLISALNSDDILQKHYGAIGIRKLLSTQNKVPIQDVIDSGIVPTLVSLLTQTIYPQLQMESLWSLANIASGSTMQTQIVVSLGVIPLFLSLLQSPILKISQQAIWGIGNIAGDNPLYRDQLIAQGGIQKLVKILVDNFKNQSIAKNGIWAVANMCRGAQKPHYNLVKKGILMCCRYIIYYYEIDPFILSDCLWSISYHRQIKDDLKKEDADSLIHKISLCLQKDKIQIVLPSLRILGNLFQNESLPDTFLKNNGMDLLIPKLESKKLEIRAQTCFLIGRITDIHNYDIESIFANPKLLPKLFELFAGDLNRVKIEIGYLFSNLCCQDNLEKVFCFFNQSQILSFYCAQLSQQDDKLIQMSLQSIQKILRLGNMLLNQNAQNLFAQKLLQENVLSKIDLFQYHTNNQISKIAHRIVSKYYGSQNKGIVGGSYWAAPNS